MESLENYFSDSLGIRPNLSLPKLEPHSQVTVRLQNLKVFLSYNDDWLFATLDRLDDDR